ncbi:MAG: 16S rRNA (guanine(527)-N(7))-methyltransferase RsmG [Clostridia bacterium]|nr:16S rRNA (guanine(527)-N(7))-methyltransferase RsmG [Clostridia bacterium]
MNQPEVLKEIFNLNKISLNDLQIDQFLLYYKLLIETNEKFNLTAITDFEEVIQKHFVDSVINYTHFAKNGLVCDIGSGAGFPAIPLKIMRPDLKIVAVDSLNKRVNFLQEIAQKLGFENFEAIHSRAQELHQFRPRESFDYVTARAVAELNILTELCAPYVKINGEFIALKSANIDEELLKSKHAILTLGLTKPIIEDYIIISKNTQSLNRKILYFKKVNHTPLAYPRPKNKITQNPL